MNRGKEVIFRIVDFANTKDIDSGIDNLRSHIAEWILSPYEMSERGMWGWGHNIIRGNPHLISVYTDKESMKMPWNHGLSQFDTEIWGNIWVIIDAPTIKNPEVRWSSMDHLVIDAQGVPLEERQVKWIVINKELLKVKWRLSDILDIWWESWLPVYEVEVWLDTNWLDLKGTLIEIATTDT